MVRQEIESGGDFTAGFWRLADPKISLASFASIFLGACLAARQGSLEWGWLILTGIGVFAIEVAKNASGDVVDFDSGTDQAVPPGDRSPFSGGKRVLVDGLLTRNETCAIAGFGYALGLAVAIWIALARGVWLLGLAALGAGIAYFYHARPLQLAYRGWGEAAVALTYGPLLCAGVYFVQVQRVDGGVLWLASALGLLISAFLWINEFPDSDADRDAGKRTWVVRLGRRRAVPVFAGIVLGAYLLLALAPFLFPLSPFAWLGGLALPLHSFAFRRLRTHPESTAHTIPAQAATLLGFVVFALGVGLGVRWG